MQMPSECSRLRLLLLPLTLALLLELSPPVVHAQDATPTPTPSPTAAFATVTESAPKLTVQNASVNVRSGPGTAYPVIGKAAKGQQYSITGRDAGSTWWQVDFKGRPGWMAASLVKAGPGTADVKAAENIPPPPGKATAPGAASATAAPVPAGPPLPPYQDAVSLREGTTYPVRARSVKGWGYELVDASKDYDLLVNRDVFGAFIRGMWPDLLQKHPGGMRFTFADPLPDQNYQFSWRGFGDGVSAWVADLRCSETHTDENGTIWQNEVVDCSVTLVSPGPGLTDLAIASTVLAYGRATQPRYNPAFDQPAFAPLGKAVRDVETGQWRWSDPFIRVVSLKPVPVPTAAAPPTPKGPLPPPSGRIAFTRGRDYNSPSPAGVSDIVIVDAKTGETRVMAENGRQPDVRNDGRIVFNGEGGGRDDLQVVEPDGSRLRPISVHPEDSAPRWSDDGKMLAFHSLLGAATDQLFLQRNAEAREEPILLRTRRLDNGRYPFWTSRGVGFSGCIGGGCGIWLGGQQLTTFPEDRATDVYADSIVFASPKSGNWDLYTIPAAGGKARNLTDSPIQDLGGSFSPDGNYIAFMSDRGGGWGIWIIEADGANPRQLIAVPEGFGKLWDQDRLSWGP
jgi:hypothetical protein